ncbi:hypothetical protein KC906_03470 [Candidatus Kaiserbacteria bacterium]|nr:hypothetical protein [Candidatus Kaiserbacteria bacterium]MCB9812085.1 hypothetical protein [Candidatus Nomurabacteria bacterium]
MFPGDICINGDAAHPLALALAHMHQRSFHFHGVRYSNLQTFLQAITYPRASDQAAVSGLPAKEIRRHLAATHHLEPPFSFLLFKNQWFRRHGTEYQALLQQAYDELFAQDLEVRHQFLLCDPAETTITLRPHKLKRIPLRASELLDQCTRLHRRARAEASHGEPTGTS